MLCAALSVVASKPAFGDSVILNIVVFFAPADTFTAVPARVPKSPAGMVVGLTVLDQ